jgi:transposase InsO family protein
MGFVYVAFVIDAFSRRIVGWRAATSMTTALVLDAVEHAFFTRAQEGRRDLTGLIAHNDAGASPPAPSTPLPIPVVVPSKTPPSSRCCVHRLNLVNTPRWPSPNA